METEAKRPDSGEQPRIRDSLVFRMITGLCAALACGYLVYGAAFTESYRARGVQFDFKLKLDGFGYSARPLLDVTEKDESSKKVRKVIVSVIRGENLPPAGVSEGPIGFLFSLGSKLGIWVAPVLILSTVLLWIWWMGPRFELFTLLTFVMGYGLLIVALFRASQGEVVFSRVAGILPAFTFVVAMGVQCRRNEARVMDASLPVKDKMGVVG